MRYKAILIISTLLVMSMTSLNANTVFAQNTTQSNTSNLAHNSSIGLASSIDTGKSSLSLLDAATETPTLEPAPAATDQPVVGIGKYDDTDPNLVYSGSWLQHPKTNMYNLTESYSTVIGSAVSVHFQGASVSLFYRMNTFFGDVTVAIDGTEVDTIHQYLDHDLRNVVWTSPAVDDTVPHTVTFTHTTGTFMSVDAIAVNDASYIQPTNYPLVPPSATALPPTDVPTDVPVLPTDLPTAVPPTSVPPTAVPPVPTAFQPVSVLDAPGAGIYDDRNSLITYTGSWVNQSIAKDYARTEKYSNKTGSSASFTFTGDTISVAFRGYTTLGKLNVAIDGANIGTINEYTKTQTYQKKWTSGNLGSGPHTIVLTHSTGTYVILDYLQVSNTGVIPQSTSVFTPTAAPQSTTIPPTSLPAAGIGTYDDTSSLIAYSGSWVAQTTTGNYLNTEHYSQLIGDTATLKFDGNSASVIYRTYPTNVGKMNVFIDGTLAATVDQYAATSTKQNKWTSGVLSSGTHTITVSHVTGTYILLDGFIVSGPPTATPTNTNTPLPTNTSTPTKTPLPTSTKTPTLVPTNTYTPTNTQVPTITPTPGAAGMYYVDSVAGADTNNGTSMSSPWKSIAAINSRKFNPGSIISFKRGSTFSGEMKLDDSGTAASPIVFTAYGSGTDPVFSNPGAYNRPLNVTGDYIIIERIRVENTIDAGIYIQTGADNVTVRYVEITNTGIGVTMRGINDKVLHSNIHDLHMVHNDVGGDDDYGAIGFLVVGSNGEIAYNTITNCKAQSYDYGVDGGTVEFYGSISGFNIHNNYAANNQGFMEVGSSATGTASNNVIAYNVMYNNGRPLGLHLTGGFGTIVEGLRFENNTVVDLRPDLTNTAIIFISGTPTPTTLTMRNNIFYLANYTNLANGSTFTHDHNLFFFNGKATKLGFTLGVGESVANPSFVDLAGVNLHLASNSPAINTGASVGLSSDYDSLSVPVGGAPDLGAFEYR